MGAYAAVISLQQTILRLASTAHFSIEFLDNIEFAYNEVESLKEVLETFYDSSSSKRATALDGQIREAVCELEDTLESHVSNQFLEDSHGDQNYPVLSSQDLLEIIDSFTQKVTKMKEEYIEELSNSLPEEYVADESSRIDSGGKKSKFVGLSDQLSRLKDLLLISSSIGQVRLVVSLVGMAGIGKTALANEVFEDPSIRHHFHHRVRVTIGRKYEFKEILQRILVQVNPNYERPLVEEDNELRECLYESLEDKRYFIILDDVWDTEVWDYFKWYLRDDLNGSRVLLTTRLRGVTYLDLYPVKSRRIHMRLLNRAESWDLLREKVFPDVSCPSQLVEAGKKIAKKCDGLPLTIVTIAGILSEAQKTTEHWNKVAEEKRNSTFTHAYDQISKVLLPSYNYLPQHLKACFNYMGVFSQYYVIPVSKLVKLMSAEGFLQSDSSETVEDFIVTCLETLVSESLVIDCQESSSGKTKTCRLHSVFWHLCNGEAGKKKVFHVLDICADVFVEGIENERRLSIQNSVLFNIKEVYNSIASISALHSLLFTCPHHQYPVPICSALRLITILDALAIRFYQFPDEVLKLVHLRYLAITYHGKLPPSIYKLWNLECLIVHRHLSIKSSEDSSHLPIEIWYMQELKHLQITGSILPDPPSGGSLINLVTLLDVSAQSCTRTVLQSIPHLKKLGIRIELTPDTSSAVPFCCFDHISHLHELESLKCVIVNPELKFEVVIPPASLPKFPSSLKKLSLSGFGYPWKYMSNIASLPNLEVLKLRNYAFRGPVWQTSPKQFLRLKFLLLEDTDLVRWSREYPSFRYLEHLTIRHCYKLKETWTLGCTSGKVELFDCDPSTSKQIQDHQLAYQLRTRTENELIIMGIERVDVHSSWEEVKLDTCIKIGEDFKQQEVNHEKRRCSIELNISGRRKRRQLGINIRKACLFLFCLRRDFIS